MSFLARIRSSPFWPMLWKEFIQMRRDRLTLAMMIGIPAVQILIFGYAIRTEVRHLPTVVLDEAQSAQSRALVQAMANTRNFDIVGAVTSRDALQAMIERGTARAAVVIPADYTKQLKRHHTATAQVIIDAADPLASSAAISAAALASRTITTSVSAAQGQPVLDIRVRPWYNPALESAVFIVPGVVALLLTLTLLLLTAMAIVRERERGTLEQLIVTPITRTGLMLGKLLPFVLVGYVQMTVILFLGHFVFNVPLRGSIPLLYALSLLFIIASLALGLFVSTLVRTQGQAMQLSFMIILPTILLSGFMFPREAMPPLAQWIGNLFPITYYLRILRGILLKGAGIDAVWRDSAALGAFAVVLITFSALRFHKTLD
ncbi:MAG: ABC transporter permease [Gemmatimonadaceae bacterium]